MAATVARQKPLQNKAGRATLADDSFARNYLAYLLARASFIVSSQFHSKLHKWQLSVPEWRGLACLMDGEGLLVGGLAAVGLVKEARPAQGLGRVGEDQMLTTP